MHEVHSVRAGDPLPQCTHTGTPYPAVHTHRNPLPRSTHTGTSLHPFCHLAPPQLVCLAWETITRHCLTHIPFLCECTVAGGSPVYVPWQGVPVCVHPGIIPLAASHESPRLNPYFSSQHGPDSPQAPPFPDLQSHHVPLCQTWSFSPSKT